MCFLGGGNTEPIKDPELERQQQAKLEQEQSKRASIKKKALDKSTAISNPMTSSEVNVVKSRKPRTLLKSRTSNMGRKSLLQSASGGSGYATKDLG
tara:strand:+ start:262 stop:549 length:288 start_codon:yes stop_codon:yes gene_type:complete